MGAGLKAGVHRPRLRGAGQRARHLDDRHRRPARRGHAGDVRGRVPPRHPGLAHPAAGGHARGLARPHRHLGRGGPWSARCVAVAGVGARCSAGVAGDGDGALALSGLGAVADDRRPRGLRPRGRPARSAASSGWLPGPAAGHDRPPGPGERGAQPAPHLGHGRLADGRRRRRHGLHGDGRLDQGVGRPERRPLLRRRPRGAAVGLGRRGHEPGPHRARSASCPRWRPRRASASPR